MSSLPNYEFDDFVNGMETLNSGFISKSIYVLCHLIKHELRMVTFIYSEQSGTSYFVQFN